MSGGEKARLVLCMIVWQRPNLLLLDEPTNHLDLATREALAMALNEFEGTVMLVSHDRALLRSVCDEFWMVSKGGVEPFDGDLDDYQRYLLEESKRLREEIKQAGKTAEAPIAKVEPAPAKKPVSSGKIKSLKQKLERLEKSMAALQVEKAAFEAKLSGTLSVEEITETGKQLQHVVDELAIEEGEWLEVSGEIEGLEGA
jgi:ATP-binding cassette subfamily F protein 3